MKKILIVGGLLVAAAIFAGIILLPKILTKEPAVCTMEAKLCPDGSYVGRTGPKCEFAPCPEGGGQVVGGDKDEHGCIGSAGYSWCGPKNKCLRIWEEACYASAEQEIQYRLAEKYQKPVADVTLKVGKKTDDYMSGSVFFAAPGLPSPGPGGLFLAAKAGNMWELVFDGNGSVPCAEIKEKYNFPANMLVGMCD
jgi:hypothetical protein